MAREKKGKRGDADQLRREATVTTTVRLPESLHRRIRLYCLEHRTSIQAVTVELLQKAFPR